MINREDLTEEQVLSLILKEMKPKYNLLVDVGASGFYSAASLLVLSGRWKGYLFEPDPRSFSKLLEKYRNSDKIKLLNKAVSNKEGTLEFLLHPEPTLSSLETNTTWYKEDTKVEKIEIAVVKLGKELETLGVPLDLDFLKIDAEGFDYRILENMFNESEYRPQIIMHEIQHPGPEKFKELMNKFGYEIFNKNPRGNLIYKKVTS